MGTQHDKVVLAIRAGRQDVIRDFNAVYNIALLRNLNLAGRCDRDSQVHAYAGAFDATAHLVTDDYLEYLGQRESENAAIAAKAKASATNTCRRCVGTGLFVTGSVNGIPVGPGGPCFRCAGKGYLTPADHRRNWGFDVNRSVSA